MRREDVKATQCNDQDLAQDMLSWETAGTSVRDDVLEPDNTSWDSIEAVSEDANVAISVEVQL
jgi:hypothetical protein